MKLFYLMATVLIFQGQAFAQDDFLNKEQKESVLKALQNDDGDAYGRSADFEFTSFSCSKKRASCKLHYTVHSDKQTFVANKSGLYALGVDRLSLSNVCVLKALKSAQDVLGGNTEYGLTEATHNRLMACLNHANKMAEDLF